MVLRLISPWRRYVNLRQSFRHLASVWSLLIFNMVFIPHASSQGKPPHQLTFSISTQEGSCDRSIALYQGERITLKFPQKVQVSVPSHDQLVKLFISGRLVVVNPLTRRLPQDTSRSGFPAVSVTTELVSGETFICRFEILPRINLREGDQGPADLHGPGGACAGAAAQDARPRGRLRPVGRRRPRAERRDHRHHDHRRCGRDLLLTARAARLPRGLHPPAASSLFKSGPRPC